MADKKKGILGPAVFAAFSIAFAYGVFQIGGGSDPATCDKNSLALVMAREPIKAQLRSPSTANFAPARESDVSVTSEDPCRYFVQSYVDAQNGFGATVRTGFSVEIENAGNGWRTVSATLDD